MKRIGQIFNQLCSVENIRLAHCNARKGKRHYREVKMVDKNPDKYFYEIHRLLKDKTFRTSAYMPMVKEDSGKRREILKLPYYPDRIVHHCIVQVLYNVWHRNLIRDTYACIPGRGIHDGADRLKKALRDDKETRYCLKIDVKQFYPSIDHDILKCIIRKKIKDPDVIELIDGIIDSVDVGIPIGNYLSQFFGNLYLSGFDHWMKETERCRHYFRYCDDVVILHSDKQYLHSLRNKIDFFWASKLNLKMKENWQVFPADARGIDFLGYRFSHGFTLLRKTTAINCKRKMANLKKRWRLMPSVSVLSTVMSYEGWMRHANCLNLKKSCFDSEVMGIMDEISEAMRINNPLRRCVL